MTYNYNITYPIPLYMSISYIQLPCNLIYLLIISLLLPPYSLHPHHYTIPLWIINLKLLPFIEYCYHLSQNALNPKLSYSGKQTSLSFPISFWDTFWLKLFKTSVSARITQSLYFIYNRVITLVCISKFSPTSSPLCWSCSESNGTLIHLL